MRDTADRDILNPDEGDHTAADIDKCTKRLHMRHAGGNDIPGAEGREKCIERLALCGSAGQRELVSADRQHLKADRFSDAGENGNFTGFSGVNAEGAFFARNDTGAVSERDMKIVVGVTAHCDCL